MTLGAFFESYYRLRPVNATFTGVHDHDHRLPDWSPEGLASGVDEMRTLRVSLELDSKSPTSNGVVIARDRELAIAFLDVQIAEHESAHFQHANPSLAAGEAVFGTIALMTRPFAPIADRADRAIARLAAVPAFLEGARRSMTAGVPDEWRVKCLRECEGAERLFRDGVVRSSAAPHIIATYIIPTPAAQSCSTFFSRVATGATGRGPSWLPRRCRRCTKRSNSCTRALEPSRPADGRRFNSA